MNFKRLQWFELLAVRKRPMVPIMMYHHIAEPPAGSPLSEIYTDPLDFEMQLQTYRRLGFESVGMNTLKLESLPRRPIVLTFDDAYENFYTTAWPLLRKYGFGATLFVVANQIGGVNVWDASLGGREERLMDREQLLDCSGAGIEVGAHTCNHVHLQSCDTESASEEITGSKSVLEQVLGKEVDTFCYPYGGFTAETIRLTQAAGYKAACTTDPGMNTPFTDPYTLRRINCRYRSRTPLVVAKWVAMRS